MKPIRSGWTIWPPVIIVRYWILQGSLYMNWAERAHRLSLEALVFGVIFWLFSGLAVDVRVIGAFLIAHTISAVFNGHMFAMLTHDLFWLALYKDKQKFAYYIDEMYARINRKHPEYLAGAVFFGSLARGVFRGTSDLDIRFIAQDGFWNAFWSAHMVFLERFHALLAGYPIDVYMFKSEREIRRKMDVENEKPISVYENGSKLHSILPETTGYEQFRPVFLETEFRDHD